MIPLSYISFLNTFPKLDICTFQQFKPSTFAKSWLRASRQRFQTFHSTISLTYKNFLFGKILMTSLHVVCGLGLPQSKILGTPMNSRSPEILFWKPFFFKNTCGCVLWPWPWPRAILSLASRRSVFEKAVLGLGFFLRPWPWPRALCSRLHLW